MRVLHLMLLVGFCCAWNDAHAVLLAGTDDPASNTAPPTGEYSSSGWELQGKWLNVLGTPIASQYFVTAKHAGGIVGETFLFQGTTYLTDAFYDDPESDLRICHVDTPFPFWAQLYLQAPAIGSTIVLFGRGTQRGAEITVDQRAVGWQWGLVDGVMRWGTNQLSGIENFGPGTGEMLAAEFDFGNGMPNEADLSVGDSGGGLFIRDVDGVWRLAAVNFSVSGPYYINANGAGEFNAALYDQADFFIETAPGTFERANGPGELFATRISPRINFIQDVTGVPEPSVQALALSALAIGAGRRRCRRALARR